MLTGNNQVAFFIGLTGSVHCVGMCGPLAFGITIPRYNRWLLFTDKLLYNFGRVLAYTCLGLLLGYLGKLFWLGGLQQWVSIISGAIIFAMALLKLLRFKSNNRLAAAALKPFYGLINLAIRHRAGQFVLGMLNGILPCGFVYIALFGALNTSGPVNAAGFMLFFGLGTMPLMLAAALGVGMLKPAFRNLLNKATPFLMLLLGCWFLLRGAGLNIPYLSPVTQSVGVSICH